MVAPPSYPDVLRLRYSSGGEGGKGGDAKQQFPVYNPATGARITTVQGGDQQTVAEAVRVAQEAFQTTWRHKAPFERMLLLQACAGKLEQHAEELAAILCMENGKPYQDALAFDVRFLSGVFRYFASLVDKLPGEHYDRGQVYVSVVREPHGVCAGILPFNWPPIHTGGKTAPCLAAGNCMILKPGEQAPLTVIRIVELLNEVLPPGVVQVVPGLGPEVPQALVEHPDVKMVSFTGSTPAGKAVSKTAAPSLKPLALELGGKNAMIIFDDADFDRAVRCAIDGGYFNKGEACTAASRLLVQSGIYERFVAALTAAVSKLRVGDGSVADTHVGPCVSAEQQKKVLAWIDSAKSEGAEVAAQASLPSDPALKDGFYVPATLVTNVTRTMKIAQEEVFGPVVTVNKFETEEEAVAITNESKYGLVGSVFTNDSEKSLRVSRSIDVGMIFVNNYQRNVLGLPFGGVKDSGYGREHTIDTLKEWTTAKFIQVPSGKGGSPPVWRGAAETCT